MSDIVYLAPRSVDDALTALRELGPAATVLAGGQDVMPLLNQGRLTPSHLVDVSHLGGLAAISDDGVSGDQCVMSHEHVISVGALVTHAVLARHPLIRRKAPLLSEAAGQIGGGIQVRNRGTIGGAVSAANPAYDLPACLVALDAMCVLASTQGTRRVPAAAFFAGPGRTARRPDELLVAIEVAPQPSRSGSAYAKLKFTDGGYNIAGAACVLTMAPDGTCLKASLALSGVAEVPLPLPSAETLLTGARIADNTLAALAAVASSSVNAPITDVMADGDYRRAMSGVMAAQAVERASARALRGDAP